jgi:hypothetical protein
MLGLHRKSVLRLQHVVTSNHIRSPKRPCLSAHRGDLLFSNSGLTRNDSIRNAQFCDMFVQDMARVGPDPATMLFFVDRHAKTNENGRGALQPTARNVVVGFASSLLACVNNTGYCVLRVTHTRCNCATLLIGSRVQRCARAHRRTLVSGGGQGPTSLGNGGLQPGASARAHPPIAAPAPHTRARARTRPLHQRGYA